MPTFGILSDLVAARDKTPHIKLPVAYMTNDSQNCYYDMNGVQRMPGRSPELSGVVTPDGFPIIRFHYHTDESSNVFAFVFTKSHIYKWNTVTSALDTMFTSSGTCDYWSSVSMNGKVIATNFVDKVQVWSDTSPATVFSTMGSASGIDIGGAVYLTKARFVIVYETYLHFLYVEEGGVAYPARDRWSSRSDETDFDSTGAGDTSYRDFTPGLFIVGAGIYSASVTNILFIFTNNSIEKVWLVEDDLVFDHDTYRDKLGCIAPDSIVNDDKGNLFYLGTDFSIHAAFSDLIFSLDIETTMKAISPSLRYYIRSYYNRALNRIWWSIPKNSDSVQNDLVISMNTKLNAWDPVMEVSISAFGEFSQQVVYTIDTIPFDTINSIGWETIDGLENAIGNTYDICGSYDGYTYKILGNTVLDAGEEYTSEVVLGTDLTQSQELDQYKRIDGFWVWFKRFPLSGYVADILIQTDRDDDFVSVATIDFSISHGDICRQWCPVDVRGRDFLIKISTVNDFIFYGIKFRFSWDGEE
jgi:hypothetical protein